MPAQITEPTPRRCAIYTRKSMDLGLERQLNSLETQRTICSSFITSQGHKGWLEIARHYDDGGWSGATLDRPELQALVADIEKGMVDIVVVYKLDRISRTLLDFVRLMDLFERYGVAFVSITQNFDTSDSMGRLILNVLLTFAQFEREIMADRIRDKRRLLRQSGHWGGGLTPLGYCVRKQVLQVVPPEAETVRFLFEAFDRLGDYRAVARECRTARLHGRRGKHPDGRRAAAFAPHTAALTHLLGNPVYIGLITYKGETFPGLHEPIIDKALFDRVQVLRERIEQRLARKRREPELLRRLVFDCYGRPMTRHHCLRGGHFNDYYASIQNDWGRRHRQRPLWVRADSLDELICAALQDLLTDREAVRTGLLGIGCLDGRLEHLTERTDAAAGQVKAMKEADLRQLLQSIFMRVELSVDRVKAVVRWREIERFLEWDGKGLFEAREARPVRPGETRILDIPFAARRSSRSVPPPAAPPVESRPVPKLIDLILKARRAQALRDSSPGRPLADLARELRRKEGHLDRLLKLNYLAPDIVAAILNGTQPADLTRKKLATCDLPLDWAIQRRLLGFAADRRR